MSPEDEAATIRDARLQLALLHVARTGRPLEYHSPSFSVTLTPPLARYMLGRCSAREFLKEADA